MSKGSYSWAAACIDDYKPLDNTDKWDRCPNCSEYPRVWVFDNGNYAKCRCSYKYEEPQATAESITSACYKRGIPYEEYQEYLRKEWNAYCFNERVSLAAPEMLEALKKARQYVYWASAAGYADAVKMNKRIGSIIDKAEGRENEA